MEKKIRALILEGMREKNKVKTTTYKSILEGAQKIAKSQGADVAVTDEMVVKAIQNELKQLEDIEKYCRCDATRWAKIKEEVRYCNAVLPKMASDEEVLAFLTENGIEKNIGACMKALKEHFGSNLDGRYASAVAKGYVNSRTEDTEICR